jgi:hypothetical protein
MQIMSRKGLEFLDWIYLAENREHRVTDHRGLLNSAYLLTGFKNYWLPKDSAPWCWFS